MKIRKDSPIIQRLKEKQRLLAGNDQEHEKIKTALIVAGGVMRGVFSGGCLVGLEELGFSSVFDVVVGVSAGAANLAYFLSGQGAESISIYYRDMNDFRFFNPFKFLHLLKRFRKVMNMDYVEDTLRHGRRELNVAAVRNSRSQFYAGITRRSDGQGQLRNIKEAKDMITVIKASMTPPLFYPRPIVLDGEKFLDGGMSLPLSVKETIELFNPTDLLVIINRPCDFREKKTPSVLAEPLRFILRLPRSVLKSYEEYNRNLDLAMRSVNSMNIGVICPEHDNIGMFERDAVNLEQCARSGTEMVKQLFS